MKKGDFVCVYDYCVFTGDVKAWRRCASVKGVGIVLSKGDVQSYAYCSLDILQPGF